MPRYGQLYHLHYSLQLSDSAFLWNPAYCLLSAVPDINGELEECYEMMYKEPVQESDIRGLVLDTVSKFYHNIRDGR